MVDPLLVGHEESETQKSPTHSPSGFTIPKPCGTVHNPKQPLCAIKELKDDFKTH